MNVMFVAVHCTLYSQTLKYNAFFLFITLINHVPCIKLYSLFLSMILIFFNGFNRTKKCTNSWLTQSEWTEGGEWRKKKKKQEIIIKKIPYFFVMNFTRRKRIAACPISYPPHFNYQIRFYFLKLEKHNGKKMNRQIVYLPGWRRGKKAWHKKKKEKKKEPKTLFWQ